MTKDNKNYYELLIKINFDKDYKTNDTLTFSCKTEKMRLIKMFETILGGG